MKVGRHVTQLGRNTQQFSLQSASLPLDLQLPSCDITLVYIHHYCHYQRWSLEYYLTLHEYDTISSCPLFQEILTPRHCNIFLSMCPVWVLCERCEMRILSSEGERWEGVSQCSRSFPHLTSGPTGPCWVDQQKAEECGLISWILLLYDADSLFYLVSLDTRCIQCHHLGSRTGID